MLISIIEFFFGGWDNPVTRSVYRKNKMSLSLNIKSYQNLLKDRIGISVTENKKLGECYLEISLYECDKITTYSIPENFINSQDVYVKEEQEINNYQDHLIEDLPLYLQLIESKHILIQNKNNLLDCLDNLLKLNFIGHYRYVTNAELKNKLISDIKALLK